MKKANTKRILAAIMSAAILASVTAAAIPSASAVSSTQSQEQQTSPYLIDYSKTASLTLYKYEMPDVSKATEGSKGEQTDKIPEGATPLADVTFTVTKVAELKDCIDNGKLTIPSLEEAEKAAPTSTEIYTATTDTTGVAKLENLPLGIYYVQETKSPSQVVKKIAPFVLLCLSQTVTVQSGCMMYIVILRIRHHTVLRFFRRLTQLITRLLRVLSLTFSIQPITQTLLPLCLI